MKEVREEEEEEEEEEVGEEKESLEDSPRHLLNLNINLIILTLQPI